MFGYPIRGVALVCLLMGGLSADFMGRCWAAPAEKKVPPASPWIEELVGDEQNREKVKEVSFLDSSTPATDTDLRLIASLPNVEQIDLTRIQVTRFIRNGQPGVMSTNIGSPEITDAGILHIAKLPHLTKIVTNQARLTDRTCRELSNHPTLETIGLAYSQITDAGFMELAKAPSLKVLDVLNTTVTKDAAQAFRKLRPDVKLHGP